jgi:hypothetical protein
MSSNSRPAHNNGEWLCTEGDYRNLIESLCTADPRLMNGDQKRTRQKISWSSSSIRIVHLQLHLDKAFQQTGAWSDTESFDAYLAHHMASITAERNVILVEGLSRQLISTLGSRFDIQPSFFVEHERTVIFTADPQEASDFPLLPSCIKWRTYADGLTMKYFEPMGFSPPPPSFGMVCAETGRHIGVSRVNGKIESVGVCRRKCSIWPAYHKGGGYTSESSNSSPALN